MNCIIPGLNVKVVAKSLQALSKVGDELYIEIRKDHLTFVILNISKTVCTRYKYLDSFFSSYEVNETEISSHANETITCKIHMKILLPLFRNNVEKKLDFIKIEYETNSDNIIIKMKYKLDDIIMIQKLRLMDSSESLTIGNNTDSGCNNVCASSTFFNQLLTIFSTSDDEITFEIAKEKVIARNYCVGVSRKSKASVRSQVNLNSSEFSIFNIVKETTINFSLRPFRTAIQFAEFFNLNIGFNFEVGGKPLAIVMKNPTFEVNFIVATMDPYSDMHSTMSTNPIPSKITQINNNDRGNITVEDRQALENVDWDDINMETDNMKSTSSTSSKKSTFSELLNKAKQRKKASKDNVNDWMERNNSKSDNKTINGNLQAATTDLMDTDNHFALEHRKSLANRVQNSNTDKENRDFEFIPDSPESPMTKRARLVFGRCFDKTFNPNVGRGAVLAENSDSD